ncbi:polysaccharide deacetylase [Soonwooa sp.]|uniref:polysaccharide deacetylase n=1 Tax=Soonwooa sp. TaxID=1938592 RepID=UPI00260C0822|nr:polysaccharide deacetylase [Soonwooa sp.]
MLLLSFNLTIPFGEDRANPKLDDESLIASLEHNLESFLSDIEIYSILVTFFVEVRIAERLSKTLKKLTAAGHEVALYNIVSSVAEIEIVKNNLEDQLQKSVRGLRQKLLRLPEKDIRALGFSYVSNIEHSNIGFVFRRLKKEKTQLYYENSLAIVPESLSPYSQLPFNDYVFQMTPLKFYENMILETLQNEDYVQVYMNAWQLYEKENLPYKFPFYKKFNLGKKFEDKLLSFLEFIDENEIATSRMKDYLF